VKRFIKPITILCISILILSANFNFSYADSSAPVSGTRTGIEYDTMPAVQKFLDRHVSIAHAAMQSDSMDDFPFETYKAAFQDLVESNKYTEYLLAAFYRRLYFAVNISHSIDYFYEIGMSHSYWYGAHVARVSVILENVSMRGMQQSSGCSITFRTDPMTNKIIRSEFFGDGGDYLSYLNGMKPIDEVLDLSWAFDPDYLPVSDSGWTQDKDGWRYKAKDGTYICDDWAYLGRQWYYFDENGYMYTGWLNPISFGRQTKQWYFLSEDGTRKEGWLDWNGHRYYLQPNLTGGSSSLDGLMHTGWLQNGTKRYFLNLSAGDKPIGSMKANEWYQDGAYWYWFQSDGTMACDETIVINGKEESFDSGGIWISH
jgi:hypothetical protein